MQTNSFVAIDFECGNNSRLSACSVGLALFENGSLTESRHFLLKPADDSKFTFTKLHGLTYDDCKNQGTFKDLWYEIDGYLRNRFLVAHNAMFDMMVLKENLLHYELPYENYYYNCTHQLATRNFSNLKDYKLETVCNYLKIPYGAHDAELDAVSAGHVFQHLLNFHKHPEELFNGQQIDKDGYIKSVKSISPNYFSANSPSANIEGLEFADVDGDADLSFFSGKNVIVTGNFDVFRRDEIENYVRNNGGKLIAGVSGTLNIIIIGTEPGWSKIEKVKSLKANGKNIIAIDESEFCQLHERLEALK